MIKSLLLYQKKTLPPPSISPPPTDRLNIILRLLYQQRNDNDYFLHTSILKVLICYPSINSVKKEAEIEEENS